ncbi:hypothetical protein M011DRAFT_482143 [Sporormia fimetaria CBS 119925]|uniref:Piwi domain-containing protein n=1 Tax=Sporormia fimetaria CBS 119925 TaxID=1340428 RepID=A0A6A6UWP1_9PLEO|nr:hypothetical protein M011DRAFT_482143 [Sporormia fimetaria CBS 119925]
MTPTPNGLRDGRGKGDPPSLSSNGPATSKSASRSKGLSSVKTPSRMSRSGKLIAEDDYQAENNENAMPPGTLVGNRMAMPNGQAYDMKDATVNGGPFLSASTKPNIYGTTDAPAVQGMQIDTSVGRTAQLGQQFYELQNLPNLLVLDIATAIASDERELIKSRKLRHLAIQKLLNSEQFSSFRSLTSVVPHENGDYVIIPETGITDSPSIGELEDLAASKLFPFHSGIHKMSKGGGLSEELVCTIGEKRTKMIRPREDTNPKDRYPKLLMTVMKTVATAQQIPLHQLSWYGIDHEFFDKYPTECTDDAPRGLQYAPASILDDKSATIGLKVRYRPEFENEDPSCLRMDLDLVPTVKRKSLDQVVFDLFGRTVLGPSLPQLLPNIKQVLLGLRVECSYWSKRTEDGNLVGGTLGSKPPAAQSRSRIFMPTPDNAPQGRKGIIQDVKLPGEVEDFVARMDASQPSRMVSVAQYFNNVILAAGGRKLVYEGLPLANIGDAATGRSVWVPLELLLVSNEQSIRCSKLYAKEINDKRERFFDNYDAEAFPGYCDKFIQSVRRELWPLQIHETSSKIFRNPRHAKADIVRPKESQITDLSLPGKSFAIVFVGRNRDAFAYVDRLRKKSASNESLAAVKERPWKNKDRADNIKAAENKFAEDVSLSLEQSSKMVPAASHIAVVHHFADLLTEPSQHGSELTEMITAQPDVILGIVDTTGRSKADVRDIYSALHRFGDRNAGSITVCTTKQSLDQMIRTSDGMPHFPGNLQRKIKYMLGGKNFEVDILQELTPRTTNLLKSTMVVGAHVYHQSSEALRFSPSIAAVVASDSPAASHFPGSARLQPRRHSEEDLSETPRIMGLRDMMKERFLEWRAKNGLLPSGVLFYRDGITHDDPVVLRQEVVDDEISMIQEAYNDVCEKDSAACKIAYILVNKTTKLRKEGLARNAQQAGPVEPYVFAAGSHQKPDGYCYTVCRRVDDLEYAELEKLTKNINCSSQLAPEVASALPVFYAQKLCKRMSDYIHFCQTRDLNHFPPVISFLGAKSTFKNEEFMADELSAYLSCGKLAGQPAEMNGEKTPTQADFSRQRPWHKKLDSLMFYL